MDGQVFEFFYTLVGKLLLVWNCNFAFDFIDVPRCNDEFTFSDILEHGLLGKELLVGLFRFLLLFLHLLRFNRCDHFFLILLLLLFQILELFLELRNFFHLFLRASLQLFIFERNFLDSFLVFCYLILMFSLNNLEHFVFERKCLDSFLILCFFFLLFSGKIFQHIFFLSKFID